MLRYPLEFSRVHRCDSIKSTVMLSWVGGANDALAVAHQNGVFVCCDEGFMLTPMCLAVSKARKEQRCQFWA